MTRLAAALQVPALLELLAAAVKICLQEVRGGQEAAGNHEAKGRYCKRPKMEKWNHRWQSASPSKVYTRVRSRSNVALIRKLISPSSLLKLPNQFCLHHPTSQTKPGPNQIANSIPFPGRKVPGDCGRNFLQ